MLAADVYKSGVLAASLSLEQDGSTYFSYLPGYGGPPVATTLPTSGTVKVTPGGALPAFFTGLLPEGARLYRLQKRLKTSPDNELALLLAIGSDVPGDVQVFPRGAQASDSAPAIFDSFESISFGLLGDLIDPHGIPGVQEKLSAKMLSLPTQVRGRQSQPTQGCAVSGILKLNPREYPHLILNEFAHLQAARKMKLSCADAELVADREQVPGLFVKRFDRVCVAGQLRRLACEDASQVLNIPPALKYDVATESLILQVARLCSAEKIALRNLFMQFLFAWLTGNGDLHAKNVSVLQVGGSWQVAPLYDLPCTLIYGDDSLALSVGGRKTNLKIRDWLNLAADIELPQKSLPNIVRVVLEAASSVDWTSLPFHGSPLNGTLRELRHRRWECEEWLNSL